MKPFHSPTPIEPLSDIQWRRIENSVFAKVAEEETNRRSTKIARSPKVLWFVPAALVVASLLFFFRAQPEQLDTASQSSFIRTLDRGSELVLGAAIIDISPHSALKIQPLGEYQTVIIEEGTIRVSVADNPPKRPIVFRSGDVRLEVFSAVFSASNVKTGQVVEVFTGELSLTSNSQRSRLVAGDVWPPKQTGVSDSSNETVDFGPFQQDVAPTRAHSPATTAPVKNPKRNPSKSAQNKRTRKKERPQSDQQKYQRAASIEVEAPNRAIAMYRELAAQKSPWAGNALFAYARLAYQQKKYALCRTLLKKYLKRFPAGGNVQDAQILLKTIPQLSP